MFKTILAAATLAALTLSPISAHADDKPDKAVEKPIPENFSYKTSHKGVFNGTKIDYNATVSNIILKNGKDDVYAEAVVTSYVKRGGDRNRPVTFVFNGGPGSSSVWLHLGLMGPKRVIVPSDAKHAGNAPYKMEDNKHSPLDTTDIVMIDPIGTGYSRLAGKGEAKDVWGLAEDSRSVSDIMREWIRTNNRWNAPKYILGESYGTTRAAAMLPFLQGGAEPMSINGVILVSQALDYTGSSPWADNLIAFVTYLPTMAATAWYHDKLENKPASLDEYMAEVRAFAMDEYLPALFKGTSLPKADFDRIAAKLAGYLALDVDYVKRSKLRILAGRYVKELLRNDNQAIGRLDARYKAGQVDNINVWPSFDAGSAAITGAYSTALHDYMANDLKVKLDRPYFIRGRDVGKNWVWNRKLGGDEPVFVNTAPDLAEQMMRNPAMKVMVASGYLDYATPFFDAEYTFWRHGIDMDRVSMTYYPAGHMMYLHQPSLVKVAKDIHDFIKR